MLDQIFELNGKTYRAREEIVPCEWLGDGESLELKLYHGDEDITWDSCSPSVPDDIAVGDLAILLDHHRRRITTEAVRVVRVTKTQIETDDGRRWMRSHGKERGASMNLGRAWRRLHGYDEQFMAWRKARDLQDEHNKSEKEKRTNARNSISPKLKTASLETLRRISAILEEQEKRPQKKRKRRGR